MRIFDDANGHMWKASVRDVAGEVLCVSQFTLLANTSKGNKPDFHKAMVNFWVTIYTPSDLTIFQQGSSRSRDLYTSFLEKMKDQYAQDKIKGKCPSLLDPRYLLTFPMTKLLYRWPIWRHDEYQLGERGSPPAAVSYRAWRP